MTQKDIETLNKAVYDLETVSRNLADQGLTTLSRKARARAP